LEVGPYATMVSGGSVKIGDLSGSRGEVELNGEDTSWAVSDGLTVGDSGEGHLEVYQALSSTNGFIGRSGSGIGEVTVDGDTGRWHISDSLYVGGDSKNEGGIGVLNIRDEHGGGGNVVVGETLRVRRRGQVNLDGGELRVGMLGTGLRGIDWNKGRLALTRDNTLGDTAIGANTILELGAGTTLTMKNGRSLSTLGRLELGDNSKVVLNGGYLIHTGERLELDAGRRVSGNGQVFTGAAGLNLGQGGELAGDTTGLQIWGDLYGSGSVLNTSILGDVHVGNSTGVMAMTNVDLSDGTLLFLELAGAGGAAGTDFDQIVFNGKVDLTDVALDVQLLDGLAPQRGDSFNLFDYSSADVTGVLDIRSLPVLEGKSLFWDTSELYTIGKLKVGSVPVPAAVWLFGSALFAPMVFLRRRRAALL
jgi:T5SS/PEP-CTERM-associated repeat protein